MSTAHALPPDESRRADGPVLLSLPPRPPGGRRTGVSEGDSGEFAARDVLNALRYHFILFLFLGTLVAAGAGFAAWTYFPAKFTTYAMLRVFSNEQAVAERSRDSASRTEFGTYLSTQAALIKSHKIMNRALRQPVGGGQLMVHLPMMQGLDDPISFLEERIIVEFSDRSEIMKVMMVGDDSAQITSIVNAVVDSFIKEVETYKQYQQARYDKLLRAKNEQEKSLEDLQKNYQDQFRKVAGNEASVKSRQARMAKYIQLLSDQGRVQNELRRIREQLAFAEAREKQQQQQQPQQQEIVVPELGAMVDNDGAVAKKTAEVNRIDTYISYYTRTSNNKDTDHIKDYRRKLSKEQGELEELKKQTRSRLVKAYIEQQKQQMGPAGAAMTGPVAILKLHTELQNYQIEETIVKDELAKYADLQQEEVATEPPPEKTLMEIRLRALQDRVGHLNTLTDNQRTELTADDRVQLYEKANPPQHKEMKKQLVFTAAASLAGYFLVGGLITVGEMRKKRVYSHRESLFAHLPLLGRIPEHGFVAPSAGAEPAADDVAGLAFREAVDRVKTLTLRQMAVKKLRTLLVTSPNIDEGKSILAWNLATGFARTDFRVLYVEANLIRPTIHEHLGIEAPAGMAEVLRGEKALADAIIETPVANLWCLCAGQPDPESRRCLDKPAMGRLLDKARSDFDFVVIDSCAMAEAVDPLCIAQRADAAVISLRTFRSRTPEAEQALQRLQLLGTPVLGVVLTDPTLTNSEV